MARSSPTRVVGSNNKECLGPLPSTLPLPEGDRPVVTFISNSPTQELRITCPLMVKRDGGIGCVALASSPQMIERLQHLSNNPPGDPELLSMRLSDIRNLANQMGIQPCRFSQEAI